MHEPILDLLCIGEAMAEIRRTPTGQFDVSFAGDCFNTAVYASRLLPEKQVGFCSVIGPDPLSEGLMMLAREENINTDHLQRHDSRNIGVYAVATDERGERSFHYWRNQSAARTLLASDHNADQIPQAKIIYFSAISLAIMESQARGRLFDIVADLQQKGCLIAFDSNFRPQLWEDLATAQKTISQAWKIADIALPSIDDEMALFNETNTQVIARFTEKKWHRIAIKQGENGPLSPDLLNTDHPHFLPAETVIDTTAAGDSFNAGFLAALLQGQSYADCLTAGHALARRAVGVRGALIPKSHF